MSPRDASEALDRELVGLFLEELEEGLHHLNVTLLALEDADAGDQCAPLWSACLRTAHSLKGAAQATRAFPISDAFHLLEDLFTTQRGRGEAPGSAAVRSLLNVVDAVAATAERLGQDEAFALDALARFVESRRAFPEVADDSSAPLAAPPEPPARASDRPRGVSGGLERDALDVWGEHLTLLGEALSDWTLAWRGARERAADPTHAAALTSAWTHLHEATAHFEATRAALEASRAALGPGSMRPRPAVDRERACGRRLLVVDDSPTMRSAQRRLFEEAGYLVEAAKDGLEAWEMLSTHSFDAVVSDVIMPELDGIGLTERIRRSPALGALPVVLVSSMDGADCEGRALDAGAAAYVVKTASGRSQMVATVAHLLGGAP